MLKKFDGNIDNLGAYCLLILGDGDPERKSYEYEQVYDVNNIKYKVKCDKYVVKGARLNLYPVGFNIYKCSRGVKKPEKLRVGVKTLKKWSGIAPRLIKRNYEISYNTDEQETYSLNCLYYSIISKGKKR